VLPVLSVLPNDSALEKDFSFKETEAYLFSTTISKKIQIEGQGLFTGKKATLSLIPAPQNTGIVFQRMDLSGNPFIPATLQVVKGTPRCTILGDEKAGLQTVEHLLSCLYALQIDNLIIQLDGPEIPIFDGSAKVFVKKIEEAGIQSYSTQKVYYELKNPVVWSEGDVTLVGLPSKEFKVSYTLHYPHNAFLGSQYFSYLLNPTTYRDEIAPCRTFSLYEEVAYMVEKGLIKGGGLENGVVIKGNEVMNPEGLRYKNEMVRHKVLDLIGDLSLLGIPFFAHIIAIRSGHSSNIAFAKKIQSHLVKEKRDP